MLTRKYMRLRMPRKTSWPFQSEIALIPSQARAGALPTTSASQALDGFKRWLLNVNAQETALLVVAATHVASTPTDDLIQSNHLR